MSKNQALLFYHCFLASEKNSEARIEIRKLKKIDLHTYD